jgi:phosphatidate cytidylyltransferase
VNDETQRRRKESTEGVRIIGADEAAEALERDDVAKRRPDDAPRYGDRPEPPSGPRPAIRFPLSASRDPADVDRPPLVPPPPHSGEVALPHWTEPATGEVPRMFPGGEGDADNDDLEAWASFTSSQPRWRGEGTASEADEYDDFSRLADDDTRIGALVDRPDPDEFFSFDEFDEQGTDEALPAGGTRSISSDPRRSGATRARSATYERPAGAGRNLSAAAGVGLGIGAVALLLFSQGPRWAMVAVTAVIVLAAAELFNALRRAGYEPATLLGLSATAALVLASYWKGESAIPLVLFLTVVFGLCWYLVGAGGDDRPVAGFGATLLGVCYVGVLGSFAALILTLPDGVGILLAAVIGTVGYDVGGYFIGRSAGTHALADVSPNKTVEGLLGGMLVAVAAVALVNGVILGIHPFDELGLAAKVGIAIALAAPLGDLCESLLKRDLGIKDMGDILPGHGGLLDRFDAMLFALPATYYAARILLF